MVRSTVPVSVVSVLVVLSVGLAIPLGGQVATAAQNVHDGAADPSTVDEATKVSHTFTFEVDNVSNDGNGDELFLTFPNSVSTENLSSFSGNVTDADTGESVSISSSVSIVDGPDGDGVQETVKVGVQPEGERASIDLIVTFTGAVTWPEVDQDTDLPLKASVTDSKFADVSLVQFASVTVVDGDGGSTPTATPTPTPTEPAGSDPSPTPTGTPTPTPTEPSTGTPTEPSGGTPTEPSAGTPTESPATDSTPTSSPTASTTVDGPGFGPLVAVLAVLGTALLLLRRGS